MNRSQFRKLIILMFVLFIGDIFAELLLFTHLIPETIRAPYEVHLKLYEDSAPFALAALSLALYAFTILGTLIALTGLFKLSRWGRTLLTVTLATFPIHAILGGVSLTTWVGNLFAWGYFLAAGITLGVAWFSPLKDQFSADNPRVCLK